MKPCASKPPARTTRDPGALAELHQLCRDGCLYDIERWIRAGRPLQVAQGTTIKGRRLTSALEIALEAGNHSLLLLLLCNGYDPNLEARSPLDLAIRSRRWDLVCESALKIDPSRFLTELRDLLAKCAKSAGVTTGADGEAGKSK